MASIQPSPLPRLVPFYVTVPPGRSSIFTTNAAATSSNFIKLGAAIDSTTLSAVPDVVLRFRVLIPREPKRRQGRWQDGRWKYGVGYVRTRNFGSLEGFRIARLRKREESDEEVE